MQARKDVAYDLYLGDATPAHQDDKQKYTLAAASADATYGWQPQDCTVVSQYICEMPPSVFPCYPPPSPPTPPPLPPSPPSPPLAAVCERHDLVEDGSGCPGAHRYVSMPLRPYRT